MKKGESPQLDLSWWKKGKPITLKNTELDTALAQYEKAMDEWDKQHTDEQHIARIQALEGVNSAAKAVIKVCNKKVNKETIECLERFPKLISDKKSGLNEQYAQFNLLMKKQFEKTLDTMAKTLESVETAFYDVYDPIAKKQMNLTQIGDYGLGGIDALSLLIDELIKKGQTGDTIGDFKDNKNVQKFVAEIQDASQRLQKTGDEMKPLRARVPQILKLLHVVDGELVAIIKDDFVKRHPKLGKEFNGMRDRVKELEAEIENYDGEAPKLDFLEMNDRTAVADLKQKTTRLLQAEIRAWEAQSGDLSAATKKFRNAGFDKQLAAIRQLAAE